MHSGTISFPRIDRSIIPGLALLGIWFAGVSLGLWAARFHGGTVGALTLAAGRAELSIVGACLGTVLPLFLSAVAVFLFRRFGAYLYCAVRGLMLGFVLGCAAEAGGLWLAGLLLFSGLSTGCVTLWFLWRRLVNGLSGWCGDCLRCLLVVCVIGAVDHWAVAPFLARALSF